MSSNDMQDIIKKIKPVIERMSLDLFKKKPQDVVSKIKPNQNKIMNKIRKIFFNRRNL